MAVVPAALAQSEGDVQVAVKPAIAGKPSHVSVEASGAAAGSNDELPSAVVLRIAQGFKIDRRARSKRCSKQQAADFDCPDRSRIGRGTADVTVHGPLLGPNGRSGTAKIEAFIAARKTKADIAGVVVQISESQTGERGTGTGRLVRLPSNGTFGAELRFDDFPEVDPPPGYRVELDRLTFRAGAKRVVKKKRDGVVKKRRFNLIRNPRTCAGSWPYEVRVTFSGGDQVRTGSVPCTNG